MKKILMLLVAFAIILNITSNVGVVKAEQNSTENDSAVNIPENLGECFEALKGELTPEDLEVYKNMKEEDLALYHMSIGLWMRNTWGLWGESPLQDFFHKIGIFHPDDMSGIILTAFNRHLNGRLLNLKELTQHYVDYWQAYGSETAVPVPDSVIIFAEETTELKSLPPTKHENELLTDLESTNALVMMKAVSQIGRQGIKVNPDRISKLLSDSDVGVRLEAIYAIDRLGGANAIKMIIPALKDDNPLVRKNAVSILYRSQDTGALASIFDNSDRNMRLNIVKILSNKEDSGSLTVMIKALKDEDQEVRETASSCLKASLHIKFVFKPEELIHWLKDENPDIRMYFADNLGKRKVKKALDSIIELLNDEDDDVVRAAIRALGDMEEARAIEPLEQFISDQSKTRFAGEARKAIDIIREDKTFQELRAVMRNGSERDRQQAVLHGLKDLDDPRTVTVLIDALKDEDYWVREYAIGTLGEKKDKRAVEPLLAISETHGSSSRMARALGELGDSRAIPYLKEYLNDGYIHNRKEAAKALYDLGWRPSSTDEKVLFYFGLGSYEMLSKVGEPAVEFLLTQLNDDGMRKDAVIALGKCGNVRAVAPLVALLADIYYGHFAAKSLEELGWKPESDVEEIWFWVGKGDKKNLKENWDNVRRILFEEAYGPDSVRTEFAVFALVGSNDTESLEMLINDFKEHGSKHLAESYIMSGNPELVKIAQDWAAINKVNLEVEPEQGGNYFIPFNRIF